MAPNINLINIATSIIYLLIFGITLTNGLKCYMCGQYNEGVGSITPCLNYSDQYKHLYLRSCTRDSEKYCVKYVSELSTVRDCATECTEKEVWETQTYCCTEDGCNGTNNLEIKSSLFPITIIVLLLFKINALPINIIRRH